MRWLKTSCRVVLIIWILLLALNTRATENPSQPNQSAQAETSAEQHDAAAGSPAPTVLNEQTAEPTVASGATDIYNQYKQSSPHGDFPTWLQAIASIGLAVFAFWQINFVKRTTTASESAARAARDAVVATQQYVELTKELAETTKQSVDLARLSLSAERPYITITPITVLPSSRGPRFQFVLRNDGDRPAIIKQVFAGIKWEQLPACPSAETRRAAVDTRRIHEYVLSPGRTSREYLLWYEDPPPDLNMTEPDELLSAIYQQKEQSNREMHFFGFVLYDD